MAYDLWQYLFAGTYLLVPGAIHFVKINGGSNPVGPDYGRVTRGIGGIVMTVGISIFALGAWRLLL